MKPVFVVVGYTASGKGKVAEMFQGRGFDFYSGSDPLKGILAVIRHPADRENLILFGNGLRHWFGNDILMQGAVEAASRANSDPDKLGFIADSLRNPAEVKFLQERLGAKIINVEASDETRWMRIRERGKPGDPKNEIEFMGLNAIERGIGQDSSGQDVAGCVDLADFTIENNGTLTELEERVEEFFISRNLVEGQYGGSPERY